MTVHADLQIVGGKSDLEKAEEYRERMLEALAPVVEIISEAAADGLTIGFQLTPPDGFKRVNLAALEISKKLC